jgi:hypothetical protein
MGDGEPTPRGDVSFHPAGPVNCHPLANCACIPINLMPALLSLFYIAQLHRAWGIFGLLVVKVGLAPSGDPRIRRFQK